MRAYSRQELAYQAELIGTDAYCKRMAEIADGLLDRLIPKEKISTFDYSVQHRIIRKPDGSKTNWLPDLTPYLIPVMEALDAPDIAEVVVPKPARSGGTVVAENYALKIFDYGPSGDVMWYLKGPDEVASYADRVANPMFEDHAVGKLLPRKGSKGNTDKLKRIGAQTFELMQMSSSTTTNRQARFIVFDEPDSYSRDFRSNFIEQGRQRQRMIGNDRKIYACAHPDLGWSGGIAAAWVLSSQGIFIMKCPECEHYASPYPTKYWPDVEKFRLHYQQSPEGTPIDQRLNLAEQTAAIGCPHCGSLLNEKQRHQMVDEGRYMHKGQTLDVTAGIMGTPDPNQTFGFWIHVLMSKQVGVAELARELEGAIEHKERTGKADKLKQVLVRTFGEAFENGSGALGLDASELRKRTKEIASAEDRPVSYRMGEIPKGVKFITAAVDPGGAKFDVMLIGWDLQRRRYVLDRFTIKQRAGRDGILRDIRPDKVQDDWTVLESQVIDRVLPFKNNPDVGLPVALTFVDSSFAASFAYEFCRRMDRKRWGAWRKVRPIKGAGSATAPELSPTPTVLSKDDDGKPLEPVVTLHILGVHKLKEDVLASLGIDDLSAGQWFFPEDYPENAYQEFFNEPLIEGKWVRNGPNESLDLSGYNEAARQLLEPDRQNIRWDQSRMPEGKLWSPSELPIWAQPVSLKPKGGDHAVEAEVSAPIPEKAKPMSIFEQFAQLNQER